LPNRNEKTLQKKKKWGVTGGWGKKNTAIDAERPGAHFRKGSRKRGGKVSFIGNPKWFVAKRGEYRKGKLGLV